MRLIRTLLVLGAAGLFLPSPPDVPEGADAAPDSPTAFEMLSSAGSAASDAWSFCSRQPEVCNVAGYAAERLQAKALYSASLLWGWAWEEEEKAFPPSEQGPFASLTVQGDVPLPTGGHGDSESTLGLDDLVAPWRGPLKDG